MKGLSTFTTSGTNHTPGFTDTSQKRYTGATSLGRNTHTHTHALLCFTPCKLRIQVPKESDYL